MTGRNNTLLWQIEALILQAVVLQAMGDPGKALGAIGKAFNIPTSGELPGVFFDEGRPVVNLLNQAAGQLIFPASIRRLLSRTTRVDQNSKYSTPLIEPLSERELEILRLVAEGNSNQQIADTLFIATGTAKKHLNNIFGKLGIKAVHSASQRHMS